MTISTSPFFLFLFKKNQICQVHSFISPKSTQTQDYIKNIHNNAEMAGHRFFSCDTATGRQLVSRQGNIDYAAKWYTSIKN